MPTQPNGFSYVLNRIEARRAVRIILALSVAVLIGLAGPVAAQRYWGPDQIPDCRAETPSSVCRAQGLDLLLSKLGMPEADSLASQGFRGVRVFRYDAFGTIWPATSILARPINAHRQDGQAQAVMIQADGRLASLKRPIWENGWRELDAIIEAIRERPPVTEVARVSNNGRPMVARCLDAPTVVIELIADGKVSRWWPDTCAASPAVAQADQIAQIIAAAFPACGHFPIEGYGRGVGRVRACLGVGGDDPVGAAEVMEILRLNVGGDTRVAYDAEHQAEGVRLLGIDGRQVVGRIAFTEALKTGALGDRWLRIVRATGDQGGVTVDGQLRVVRDRNNPDPRPVSLRWIREADGVWRISDWSVTQR